MINERKVRMESCSCDLQFLRCCKKFKSWLAFVPSTDALPSHGHICSYDKGAVLFAGLMTWTPPSWSLVHGRMTGISEIPGSHCPINCLFMYTDEMQLLQSKSNIARRHPRLISPRHDMPSPTRPLQSSRPISCGSRLCLQWPAKLHSTDAPISN